MECDLNRNHPIFKSGVHITHPYPVFTCINKEIYSPMYPRIYIYSDFHNFILNIAFNFILLTKVYSMLLLYYRQYNERMLG